MDYPLSIVEHAAQHLRALRQRRHLSQGELGQMLGVSQSRIAQIENRPGSVSLEQFWQCLNALGAQLVIRTPGEEAVLEPSGGSARRTSKRLAGAGKPIGAGRGGREPQRSQSKAERAREAASHSSAPQEDVVQSKAARAPRQTRPAQAEPPVPPMLHGKKKKGSW